MLLPLERWSPAEITEYADRCLADAAGHREFNEKFPLAVETWRRAMLQRGQCEDDNCAPCEVFAVGLGPVVFVAVNAEIFSPTGLVASSSNCLAPDLSWASGFCVNMCEWNFGR